MDTDEPPSPLVPGPEFAHVLTGTIHMIHDDIKDGYVYNTPDFMRFHFDVKELVCRIRGEQFGRLLTMRGEDFSLVVVRQRFQLSQTLVCEILELLREFLLYRCGTSLSVADLTIQVPRDVPISVEYSLLDLLFLCHAFRKENLFLFKDQDRILSLVVGTPRPIEQLSYQGEGLLAR